MEIETSLVSSRPGNRILAILGFHKIDEPLADAWKPWFYIPEEIFAGYLGYLKEDGWQVIDNAAFLRGLVAPDSLPERAALLTFDDGYKSMRDVALHWLLRFGYPAILFMPSDFVGESSRFDIDSQPEEAICDWDDLWELERCGVSVQSHGASHRWFSQLDPAEQEAELLRFKATLETGLSKLVEVFAYPYGDSGSNPRAVERALERAGYRAACMYGGGPIHLPVAEPYRLARLAMGPDTDLQAELRQEPTGSL